jgi:hypothetical protein
MTKPTARPERSILIGDEKWVEFVDTGLRETEADIDPLLMDLEPMWQMLETECVAGCCGIQAFDFTPENIAAVASGLNSSEISAKIANLRAHLQQLDAGVFISGRLNHYSHRSVFDALLRHLQGEFSRHWISKEKIPGSN